MNKIEQFKDFIIRLFGLRGSWKWACRQLDKGLTIKPKNSVSVKYKLDHENQRRILWAFNKGDGGEWDNANIFLSDFEYTKWTIIPKPTPTPKDK